jgi:hypothetical protein
MSDIDGVFVKGDYENYIILFRQGNISQPLCLMNEYQWNIIKDHINQQREVLEKKEASK